MKIAVIGGGSTYTPELIEGFISRFEELPVKELSLQDIDEKRLSIVGNFAKRMVSFAKVPIKVILTLDREESLKGADFIITQIRVGGQAGRHRDILLGLDNDMVGQETTGVGGFAKALRTIPVMMEICRDIERLSPNAFLINFTNPSGIITEAILKYSKVHCIGLCNIPVDLTMEIAKFLNIEPNRITLDYVGLNHLSWVKKVLIDGQDIMGQIVEFALSEEGPKNIPELEFPVKFLSCLRMIPSDYLKYYYLTEEMVVKLKSKPKTRAQEVMEIEEKLLEIYQNPGIATKPKLLEERGGAYYSTAAVNLISSIFNDKKDVQIVNVQNNFSIAELPSEAVVEVPCTIDRMGAHPHKCDKLPPEIRGLMQVVKAYEELTIEAAVHKSYRSALLALSVHPLVRSVNKAIKILDEINSIWNLNLK